MTDLLGLIAELAVGITGFAAIASVLGRAPSEADQRLDRSRLRNLVEVGVATALLAVLPMALVPGPSTPPWVWVVSNLGLLLTSGSLALVHHSRKNVLNLPRMTGYSRGTAIVIYACGTAIVSVAAAGLLVPQVPADRAFLLGLYLSLAMTCVYFVRVAESLLTQRVGRVRD